MSKNPPTSYLSSLRNSLHNLLLTFVIIGAFLYALSLTTSSCFAKGAWCGEDIDQYKDYSDNMLSGHGYSANKVNNMYFIPLKENKYIPEIIRHPAYPTLLTLGRLIYNKPQLLIIYNYISYVGILFFTYKLSQLLLKDKWVSLAILTLTSFNATLLFYTAKMGNADTFSAFTIIGFSYFILKIFLLTKSEKKYLRKYSLLAGIFGITTVLTRTNTPFFILIAIILSVASSFTFLRNKLKRKSILAIFFSIILAIFVWSARESYLIGRLTVAPDTGIELFDEHILFTIVSNDDTRRMTHWFDVTAWQYMKQLRKEGKTIPQAYGTIDNYIQKMTINYMLSHKKLTFSHFVTSVYDTFSVSSFTWLNKDFFFQIKILTNLFGQLSLYVMFLFPTVLLFVKKRREAQFIFICILWISTISFLLVSSFYHGTVMGERIGLPTLPLVVILVGYYLQALLLKLSNLIKTRRLDFKIFI